MFFIQEAEVCNFADDTARCSCPPTLKLSSDTFNWFRTKSMVANPSKFQIMFLESNIDNSKIRL